MKPDRATATAIGLIFAYNYAVNRLIHESTHIPSNIAIASLLTELARREGLDWDDLGLDPGSIASGAALGGAVALPVGAIAGAAATSAATREVFIEDRITRTSRGEAMYHALLRIPLATALSEEMIFRGALYALFRRNHSKIRAALMSSALFGIWHILPTIDSLNGGNSMGSRKTRRIAALLGTVVSTGIAGLGFVALRERGRSIAAPVVVHATINVVAFLAGRKAGRIATAGTSRER
ncbi:MAG: hypothetical protein DCC49_05040 [Acidobacteria bacterium]|nr:MAG: hypothetical protein DCC49_05040 [Acidobacteriota bacterium]